MYTHTHKHRKVAALLWSIHYRRVVPPYQIKSCVGLAMLKQMELEQLLES